MEDQLKFDKSTFVCYKTTKINEDEYLCNNFNSHFV